MKKVYLTVTQACNMACVYCHQCHNALIPEHDLPDVCQVAQYFPEDEPRHIIFYGGEPLLYYNYIIRLADALKERNYKNNLSVITNAQLLTKEKAKVFNQLGIGVAVSHDGRHYQQTRHATDFLMIDPEPFLLLDNRNISATVCRYNYNFYDVWEYFEEFRIRHDLKQKEKIFIQVANDVEGNAPQELLIYKMLEFEQMLDQVFDHLAGNLVRNDFDSYEYMQYYPMIQQAYQRFHSGKQGSCCGADTCSCHMDLWGRLYPCHNSGIVNGSVFRDGLAPGRTNPYIHSSTCKTCDVYAFCGGGCVVTSPQLKPQNCYVLYQQFSRLIKLLHHLEDEWADENLPCGD